MEYIQHSTECNVSNFVVISGPDYCNVRYYHAKGFVWSSKIQPFFRLLLFTLPMWSLCFFTLFYFFLSSWTHEIHFPWRSNILITYSGWVMFIFLTSANRSSQHFLLRHSLICGDLILTDTEICMGDNSPNNLVLLSFSDIMHYLCKPKWFTNCCFSLFLFAFSSNCYLYI